MSKKKLKVIKEHHHKPSGKALNLKLLPQEFMFNDVDLQRVRQAYNNAKEIMLCTEETYTLVIDTGIDFDGDVWKFHLRWNPINND